MSITTTGLVWISGPQQSPLKPGMKICPKCQMRYFVKNHKVCPFCGYSKKKDKAK